MKKAQQEADQQKEQALRAMSIRAGYEDTMNRLEAEGVLVMIGEGLFVPTEVEYKT